MSLPDWFNQQGACSIMRVHAASRYICALAIWLTGGAPVWAQAVGEAVDLELVLAVDVSRSMDEGEQRLQRAGYVAAFRHPDVIAAITSSLHGRIAATYLEWAGDGSQGIIVPWSIIDGEPASYRFAEQLAGGQISLFNGTSIASAILFSAGLIESNAYAGQRRVIDVSGDGPNNIGPPVQSARDAVVARGITINGLPVMLRPGVGYFSIPDLDVYYTDCVIGGAGAFLVPVRAEEEFAAAIRRKLVLEIAGTPARVIAAAAQAQTSRIDCMVGERLRRQWMYDMDR